ncbi:hypothetical protein F0562_026201 [Nyssa sinensis]|uniref:Uncharacterized protein n=1 Tax=Nyssa sinensis TaxID=561372 RepID=A0A5J5BA53_9ASTE|nr:hypothetical protein F0562_026201 [Nyssa sinensis]
MEAKDYTQDGTVDLHGQPVLTSKTGKWKACAFLVGYEAFERMAFYGIASNLVVYLTTQLHEETVSSVRNVNNWSGSVWMTPILGAYIADSYLGRFWTFTISSLVYVLGMVLTNNGSFNKILEANLCKWNQFDDFNPHEKKLKVSFFNWWMFSSFIGALFATLGLVYVQENLGIKLERPKSPAGDLLRVPITAFANSKLQLPTHPSELHEFELQHYISSGKRPVHHTPIFRFLDKAAIKDANAIRTPCTVTQVEGAKLVLGMVMIWLVTLIPSTIWAQINTLFVKQADVFNAIGLLEFFYDQSPEDMQSLGTTFFTSGIGVGNFLNSFLVTMVDKITGRNGGKSWIGHNLNDSQLDYYYGFLLVLSAINLGAFLCASSKYIYKRESLEVKEGCVQIEGKALDTSPLGLQV